MNLDNLTEQELQALVEKVEKDKYSAALELFPDKPIAYVKTVLIYNKYAKLRLEMLDDLMKGRGDKVAKFKIKLDAIFRTLPDYAQW